MIWWIETIRSKDSHLENCCQIFTIGFVAEKRTAFVNSGYNDLFIELGDGSQWQSTMHYGGKKVT